MEMVEIKRGMFGVTSLYKAGVDDSDDADANLK